MLYVTLPHIHLSHPSPPHSSCIASSCRMREYVFFFQLSAELIIVHSKQTTRICYEHKWWWGVISHDCIASPLHSRISQLPSSCTDADDTNGRDTAWKMRLNTIILFKLCERRRRKFYSSNDGRMEDARGDRDTDKIDDGTHGVSQQWVSSKYMYTSDIKLRHWCCM